MNKNILLIDIRKSDEVYSKKFSDSNSVSVYNIPMNMIRFNDKMIIKHLEYVKNIYIVCSTSRRAQFIKDKYFANHNNIIVDPNLQFSKLNFGDNSIILNNENITINVDGSNSFNLYNIMRIIQIIMGLMILSLGGYTLFKLKNNKNFNKIPLIILLFFGTMALYNGLTSTCTMSEILINELN